MSRDTPYKHPVLVTELVQRTGDFYVIQGSTSGNDALAQLVIGVEFGGGGGARSPRRQIQLYNFRWIQRTERDYWMVGRGWEYELAGSKKHVAVERHLDAAKLL